MICSSISFRVPLFPFCVSDCLYLFSYICLFLSVSNVFLSFFFSFLASFIFLFMSAYLSVCLSQYLPFIQSLSLCNCMSVYLPVWLSHCLPFIQRLFLCVTVCLSVGDWERRILSKANRCHSSKSIFNDQSAKNSSPLLRRLLIRG